VQIVGQASVNQHEGLGGGITALPGIGMQPVKLTKLTSAPSYPLMP
jgi:hypothetical protein